MRRLLLLAAASGLMLGAAVAPTVTVPPAGEGGAKWNSATLDCTSSGDTVEVLYATYGLPLQAAPQCTKPAPIGNLNFVAIAECTGKLKCEYK